MDTLGTHPPLLGVSPFPASRAAPLRRQLFPAAPVRRLWQTAIYKFLVVELKKKVKL